MRPAQTAHYSIKITRIKPNLCELILFLQIKAYRTYPYMQFTTKVELPVREIDISHKSHIILVGSCFAGNIGKKLHERKFDINANPFGVQYNPFSISAVLTRIAKGEPFTEESPEIFEHGGKWHSIMHHSDFSRNGKKELLDCINSHLMKAHAMSRKCDTVIVTFGTAYTYTHNCDGMIAGNCHKLPAREFTRSLMDIDAIAEEFGKVIRSYKEINPEIKFLFTVSPIRHLRDGAHDNQKSKATLLLATDRIIRENPGCCHYFPAYEIVLDELRDYRFYAEDMIHPSTTAIEYIWECFGNCCFNKETIAINESVEEIIRGLGHRPFDSRSEGYKQFLRGVIEKIGKLEKQYPFLDFKNELIQCNTLLDR